MNWHKEHFKNIKDYLENKKYKIELDYNDWIKIITIIGYYSGMMNAVTKFNINANTKKNIEEDSNRLYLSFTELTKRAILKKIK